MGAYLGRNFTRTSRYVFYHVPLRQISIAQGISTLALKLHLFNSAHGPLQQIQGTV